MKNRIEQQDLIERYCQGKLTPEEYRVFIQWMESDAALRSTVKEYRELLEAFDNFKERSLLKEGISKIHDEIETEQFNFKAPLKVVKKNNTTIIQLIKKYKIPAIAAVVAVIAVCITLITFNLSGVNNGKQQSAYRELRREVENIKNNQKAIIKGINSGKQEVNSGHTFTGTGFALTQSGYIITSYHVIEDAKSVFISNEKFNQMRADTVFTDPSLDLAVLKVNDTTFNGFNDLPYNFRKTIADPGERVFTLGYPREDLIYGEGSVSSYTGYEGDTTSYQISIPLNPGNSGGPLFDNQANLIGIISGKNSSAEGASFAVKSRWVHEHIFNNLTADDFKISSAKSLKGLDRTAQIKKIRDFIFVVRVYN